MSATRTAVRLVSLACLVVPGVAFADRAFPGKDIGQLYDRIATDVQAGRPVVATIYVALCDNDSQGIVKVKNRRICNGDRPQENLYWATAGGLSATLKNAHWKQRSIAYFPTGDLAVKAVWHKTFTPGGARRARGVKRPVDVFVIGLGYRGSRIAVAMTDYLRAVNRDSEAGETVDGLSLRSGGLSHVVGYIGHDYFYDVDDAKPLLGENQGDSVLHKGTFALSCTGNQLIRPAIRRKNAHIFILNRTLGFPGAWTAEAIVASVADGKSMKEIFHAAAAAFAAGKDMSLGASLGSFAYGD